MTAFARAVPSVFSSTFRAALMAAASGSLLVALAPGASAATCSTTTGNDVCILNLAGDETVGRDGQTGSDTLQFTGGVTFNTTATQYNTAGAGNFINFEFAEVVAGTTLNIVSNATTDAPVSLAWTIGGILNVSGVAGGNAIGNASAVNVLATGVFNVNQSETIGALSGAGSIVVAATKDLSADGAGTAAPFSGIISGAGGFTKVGSGVLRLTGNNSYTGATTVSGGILEIGNAGAIDNSSSVTTVNGAQLTGTVAYTINGAVTNNGRVTGNATINGNVTSSNGMLPGNTSNAPSTTIPNPGQDMGRILINGTYTGNSGAYVGMFVDLDAALAVVTPLGNGTPGTLLGAGTHDFFDVNGSLGNNGNVSGVTKIFVAEFDAGADTGIATTGNGIQLVRITGTNTPGAFVQGSALNAGAYQYLLRYVANYSGTDDGYFLQSAARDEMVAHPALLSAGQSIIRNCFRDDQRVPDSPKGASYGRAWVGYKQGATSFGADTGTELDLDFSCTTGGMDWRMGYGWFGGVAGGFGSSNGDLVAPAGVGNLDGDARVIEAYAAFTSSNFFVNLSAGYADMDWSYTGAILATAQTSTSGLIASAQAGVALDLSLVAVKLIGAVSYDDTNCGDSCFGFGVTEDTGLLEAKGTVRFDGVTWGGAIRPWASVSYSDVLSDGINTVSLGAVSVSSDTNSELLSIDAGLQTYLDENFALFADGGYHESLSKDISGYKAGLGLKLYW